MNTVWIVGKTIDEQMDRWQFQGVFDEENKAVEACVEDSFFVGPADLNSHLPTQPIEWVGAWYPRLQTKPQDSSS